MEQSPGLTFKLGRLQNISLSEEQVTAAALSAQLLCAVMKFNATIKEEVSFFLFSFLCVLALTPLLFHDHCQEHDDTKADVDSFIQTTAFSVVTYVTLALSLPLIVDLIFDVCAKGAGLKRQLYVRAIICATLVFTASLHVYFSLYKNSVEATWAIYSMRKVMMAVIGRHQIQIRHAEDAKSKVSFITVFCWNAGVVINAYTTEEMTHHILIGNYLQMVAIILFFGGVVKHIHMIYNGTLERDWYDKWQQTAFEVLLFVALAIGSVVFVYSRGGGDGNISYMLMMSLNGTLFLVLMSIIITNEYRHDYAQAKLKLDMKRLFVRYVSHEIRTPLNSCKLGIEYMKGKIRNPTHACIEEIDGVLDEVLEGCNTALDFMNNLLLYEKIDSMEMPLYIKREDLCKVGSEVLKSFRLSARALGINLSMDIHPSLQGEGAMRAVVEIDAPKVVIVLRNLVSNALKFTPEDGVVSVTVRPVHLPCAPGVAGTAVKSVADSNPLNLPPALPKNITHFRIILSDSGRGMSQEEQEQLFTNIVQFSPNEIQKGGGSGIGLFLSHKIMSDHKLKIQVYSEGNNGNGTSFFIDFPLLPGGLEESDLPSPNSPVRSTFFPTLAALKKQATLDIEEGVGDEVFDDGAVENEVQRRPRLKTLSYDFDVPKLMEDLSILIVDDSVMNRKMMIRILKLNRIGCSYDCVGDGLELLSLLGVPERGELGNVPDVDSDVKVLPVLARENQVEYDVIFLDNHMPCMNGAKAVKILREYAYGGLIVGLTGNALEEELHMFCAAGVDYALPKPFEVGNFVRLVQKHL